MRNRTVKVILHNHVAKVKKYVNSVLEERLNKVSEDMVEKLKGVLSEPGPSKPGQPPGITYDTHKERIPGGLRKTVQWKKGKKKLTRHIGTPLERGFWLEMGVHGGVIIRPKRARALMVPISDALGLKLSKGKVRKKTASGVKRKRKRVAKRNGYIGVIQHANGKWYMLREWVIQGRIAPRPWLKPTMFKHLHQIGLTLSQTIH